MPEAMSIRLSSVLLCRARTDSHQQSFHTLETDKRQWTGTHRPDRILQPCKAMGLTMVRLKRLFLMAWSNGPPSQYCTDSRAIVELSSVPQTRVPRVNTPAVACKGLGGKLP